MVLVSILSGILGYNIGTIQSHRVEAKNRTFTNTVATTLTTTRTAIETVTYISMFTTTITYTNAAINVSLIKSKLGKHVFIDNWNITVVSIKDSKYIKIDDSYYKVSDENEKYVIVTLRIGNNDLETRIPSNIGLFMLVTDKGRSYEETFPQTYVPHPSEEEKLQAIPYNELSLYTSIAPQAFIEGDLLFVIKEDEEPLTLWFEVSWVDIKVQIELKSN
ncbi:MAG: hypothetical protein B6U89_03045 [Desulfurococcales archaeon ex4484_58]|nr:MAG: hypothetical protein B6U89_03045 [Desulfurococcales archaeon ex4484_58]